MTIKENFSKFPEKCNLWPGIAEIGIISSQKFFELSKSFDQIVNLSQQSKILNRLEKGTSISYSLIINLETLILCFLNLTHN